MLLSHEQEEVRAHETHDQGRHDQDVQDEEAWNDRGAREVSTEHPEPEVTAHQSIERMIEYAMRIPGPDTKSSGKE